MTFAPRVAEVGDGFAVRYSGYLFACLGSPVTRRRGAVATTPHAIAVDAFLDRGKVIAEITPDLAQVDVLLTDEAVETDAYPSLVFVHTSLFGLHGEYAHLAGTDVQAFALSGLMSMIGEPGREPLRIGGAQPELATGLSMFSAAMIGLFRRSSSGSGAAFDVSAVRTGAYLDWKSQIYHAAEGKVLQRGSDSGPLIIACADGYVGFYYRSEEWSAVQQLVADPRLKQGHFATQVLRDRNRDELATIMNAWSQGFTRDEIYQRSQALHIPAGSVLDLGELAASPQTRARDFITTGSDAVCVPTSPWTIDGVRGGGR